MTRYRALVLAAVVVAAGLGALAAFGIAVLFGDDDGGSQPAEFLGVRVQPPIPKPDYTLTSTTGEEFNIVDGTEGKVTLLFLGYTNCPDVCPTHMQDITSTLQSVDPDIAEDVEVVFVTTDPQRDTPEVIRRWLDLFDEDFVGLTADQETLDRLQADLGIQPARGFETERAGEDGYEVNHAAYVMAFGRNNVANLVYPFGVTREVWVNDITNLVESGFPESEGS